MKNWRTTLLGGLGGITAIIKGALIGDYTLVASGAFLVLQGFFSKDAGVTGTAK